MAEGQEQSPFLIWTAERQERCTYLIVHEDVRPIKRLPRFDG
ncbi:hypothetical protein COLO4_15180 [Corchorus olitorius]|uniref:Uncharacterized protein n=1 Tax=Corchorus olitorius TaxID=93759 RepID=A0A1R3JP96_9ROSI|nr:hypothetical protein COLO4_15180 [Corchorus olitorius]